MSTTKATRAHIIDVLGQRVEVGDYVAVATTSYDRAHLVVGRVERITATRTVVRKRARSRGYSWGDTSTVDDRLGRVVKLPDVAPYALEEVPA